MTAQDIIKQFNIQDNDFSHIIKNASSILVDFQNTWDDGGNYQIVVDGKTRECEGYKIVDNHILIVDSFTKQVTVLNIENNKSSLI